MNWYLQKVANHTVKCYGCFDFVVIATSEWMNKRSNETTWRCSDCQKLVKTSTPNESELYLQNRDRGWASSMGLRGKLLDPD